jgi:carbon-monoxide dehydrogenase small subunit
MVMATVCLLRQHPKPSDAQIAEALEGNLCRCTGYAGIVESVRHAVRQATPQEAA